MGRRIRRDLHKRIGTTGYQQIAGDLEVRGRILGPSITNLATGIAKGSGASSRIPVQLNAPIATVSYRSIILRWDKQYTLENLSHYNLSVAENPSGPWYVPVSDGVNWGYVEGSLPVKAEMYVHNAIPHAGSPEVPVGRTLYYRVQQETLTGETSAWSPIVGATTTTIENGDMAANTLTANKILAAEIATLMLRATSLVLLGYSGIGTPDNPQEGDRRLYLDEDEIGAEVYTNGSWSSERRVAMGGVDANGNFRPFLSCRGILGDMDDAPEDDALPDAGIWRFDFENNKNNQYGDDPWTVNTGTASYSSTHKWEGSYSLYDGSSTLLNMNYGGVFASPWTTGDSVTAAFMFRINGPIVSGHSLLEFNTATNAIELEFNFAGSLRLQVTKGGTVTYQDSDVLAFGVWHFIGLTYDSVANKAYLYVDNDSYSFTPTGTWGAPTPAPFYVSLCGFNDEYMDDFIVSFWRTIDADLFRQHVIRGRPWTADYIADDLVLKPRGGTMGMVHVDADSIRIGQSKTPSAYTDFGIPGQICWDSGYLYVCTARNRWERVAIATW